MTGFQAPAVTVRCGSCGADVPGRFRFCGVCGAPLTPADPMGERRRTVTILFCDVAGSTALGEQLDPETLRSALRRYFDEMRVVIETHGGRVEKFIGDAVMAVFGLPRLREDDALRAVRAAAEIRERLPKVAADTGVTLRWRTGVNTGKVVAESDDGLVVGDAVNLAARLEQAAPLGEILLGPDTYRLVHDAVEVAPVAPLSLKGKSQPVHAQLLLKVTRGVGAPLRWLDAPLVGRERELRSIAGAYSAAVKTGACRVCTLLGPAGIGKSRLAHGWLDAVHGEATIVHGRCLHYGEGITFWPLVEVLTQLGDRATRVLGRVREGDAASPEELLWEVRILLEEVAAERPLVVVLDDLHWAEPMFHDLLEHVAVRSRSAPILLLCVARPELVDEPPAWARHPESTTVTVGPLAAAESGRLLDQVDPRGDAALRDRVIAASEGNPLFAEEMLAFVREGGEGVPPTIQALIAARLEQLRGELRDVVERGAIEGKVFHRAPLVELGQEALRDRVDSHLDALVRKELVHPEPPALRGDRAYRFVTLLLRDAAYDALPKRTRAKLHEQFAGWLERRAGELAELDEISGWHLEQAVRFRRELGLPVGEELATRAARRLAAAGRRAAGRTDQRAAANLLGRARELAPADDPDRPRLALELAEALFLMATSADVIEPLLDEAAADPGTRLRATLARLTWTLYSEPGRLGDGARPELAATIDGFRRAGDECGLAKAHLALFELEWVANQAGPSEAALAAAVGHAARAGDVALVALATGLRCTPLIDGPLGPDETMRTLAEIEAASGGPFVRASAAVVRAELCRRAQRFDEARAELSAGTKLLYDVGFDRIAGAIGQYASLVELDAGDPREAVRLLRECLDMSPRLGDHPFASTTAAMLAYALSEAGELDEAVEVAETNKAESAPEDVINFALSHEAIARERLARGDLAAAEAHARQRCGARPPHRLPGHAGAGALLAGHRARRIRTGEGGRGCGARVARALRAKGRGARRRARPRPRHRARRRVRPVTAFRRLGDAAGSR